jgi:hypothetical protein
LHEAAGAKIVVALAGDRGFESISLQRRVWCEPDFRGEFLSIGHGPSREDKLVATGLLIRSYDHRLDAIQYGEELIPCVRELVADFDGWTKPSRMTMPILATPQDDPERSGFGRRREREGIVRLTCVEQNKPEAGCSIILPRLHSAIRSPPQLGRSAASIARRGGVEG